MLSLKPFGLTPSTCEGGGSDHRSRALLRCPSTLSSTSEKSGRVFEAERGTNLIPIEETSVSYPSEQTGKRSFPS